MAGYKARLESLRQLFNDDSGNVDLGALRSICFHGIPEESQLRPICWRLLLGYLPTNRNQWPKFLAQQRTVYESLIVDIIVNAVNNDSHGVEDISDHPLSLSPTSEWSTFFKDNEILLQINKDVRRLCPEISFFHKPTDYPSKALTTSDTEPLCHRVINDALRSEVLTKNRSGTSNLVTSSKKMAIEQYAVLPKPQEAHWQIVERILFIYSKLNPGIKYVQGMNEILGPIYYVFASDPDPAWRGDLSIDLYDYTVAKTYEILIAHFKDMRHLNTNILDSEFAEADAFFCFQHLMSEIKDNFIKSLDSSSCGIEFQMNRLYELLNEIDADVYQRISIVQEVLPQYYAFRWLSLLLSQEFSLPDVIRLWDSLFSDRSIFEYLIYVCLAMIINVRERLLVDDFSSNVRLLQDYPPVDTANILSLATQLRDAYQTKSESK